MAVEDHELFAEWSDAFDRLTDAHQRYHAALTGRLAPKLRDISKQRYDNALADYHEVSARLD